MQYAADPSIPPPWFIDDFHFTRSLHQYTIIQRYNLPYTSGEYLRLCASGRMHMRIYIYSRWKSTKGGGGCGAIGLDDIVFDFVAHACAYRDTLIEPWQYSASRLVRASDSVIRVCVCVWDVRGWTSFALTVCGLWYGNAFWSVIDEDLVGLDFWNEAGGREMMVILVNNFIQSISFEIFVINRGGFFLSLLLFTRADDNW